MPYRRTYRKRYTRKKRSTRSRGGYLKTAFNYGKKAFYLAKQLKSLINVEYKYHDVVTAAYNQGISPTFTTLNALTQGDTSTNRDGDSIKMKSLNIKGFVKMDSTATEVTYLRMTLFQVSQNNGVTPTVTSLWESGTGGLFDKKRELKFTDTVKILKNYNIVLQPGAKQSQIINLNWKFKDHVKYKGNAGTAADIMTNGLFLYVEAGSDTHKPEVQWSSRLRFIDN